MAEETKAAAPEQTAPAPDTKKETKALENQKTSSIKIEYTGTASKTHVPDLGEFKKGEVRSFVGAAADKGSTLVKMNPNFKEVK